MEENKNNGYIKIGTFNVKKKTAIKVGIVIAIILAISKFKSYTEEKELAERAAKLEAERLAAMQGQETPEVLSYAEQIQRQLREQFGEPPEGFEWDYTGNLVALSSEDLSYEEVAYTYVRALSILDFATAQRFSSYSKVIDIFNGYYDITSKAIADYYDNFLRKQYKFALETVEVVSVDDIAIFADGTAVLTMTLNCMDLTNKDFWQADKEELFNTMRVYDETEDDSVKKEQYIYDYIYKSYLDEKIGKREVTLDIVVSKRTNGSGWLVSDDAELAHTLSYTSGVDVAQYIFKEYNEWYIDIVQKEVSDQYSNISSQEVTSEVTPVIDSDKGQITQEEREKAEEDRKAELDAKLEEERLKQLEEEERLKQLGEIQQSTLDNRTATSDYDDIMSESNEREEEQRKNQQVTLD